MTEVFEMVRRRFALALALTSMFACTAALRAQVLTVYEPFAYPDGSLDGQNGGANWGGSWTTSGGNTVSSGGLSFGALVTSGGTTTTIGNNSGNARALNVAQGSPGTTSWISFLANLNSGASFTNSYNGVSLYAGGTKQLFMGQTFGANIYGFQEPSAGVLSSATGVDATTHFLVFSIDFGVANNTINMFVDPAPGLAFPDVAPAIANYSAASFGFDNVQIQGGVDGSATLNVDELRIGDSYGAVSPVPEPGSIFLVGAAGCGLMAVRRRRNTTQSNGRAPAASRVRSLSSAE